MGILKFLGMDGIIRYKGNILVPLVIIGLILLWAVIIYVVLALNGSITDLGGPDAMIRHLL